MPSVAYVNGRYLSSSDAAVSINDRGYQFADSVYEVVAFLNGRFVDWDKHVWRLRRTLAALFIGGLMSDAGLATIARRLVRQSRYREGILYIQVSRGVAPRDHGFPAAAVPSLVMTARRFDFAGRHAGFDTGVGVISLPDQRWARCDLKTTGLLPAVLAKQEARRAGAFEAMFESDGEVREGASTNLYLVDSSGAIITHPISAHILAGVTRDTLLDLARANGLVVHERPFTLEEARSARELFLTSTTAPILPIVQLDGQPVGEGSVGPVSRRLYALMWAEISRQTGWHARP